jgi:ribosomal-protein-alanine N-acetyltransferase
VKTNLEIRTQRLTLEPLEPHHADVLLDGLRDERLYEFIDDAPPESVDVLRSRYARLACGKAPDRPEAWLNWAVRESFTDRYTGFVQATITDSRSALIAYLLFPFAWGNGYAREAVAAMIHHLRSTHEVTTFKATVDPRNKRSIAVLQALGFVQFECRKGAAQIRGVVADELDFLLDGNRPWGQS